MGRALPGGGQMTKFDRVSHNLLYIPIPIERKYKTLVVIVRLLSKLLNPLEGADKSDQKFPVAGHPQLAPEAYRTTTIGGAL